MIPYNFLFYLSVISLVTSVLYLIWTGFAKRYEAVAEQRILHYFLLHILIALQFALLVVGIVFVTVRGRYGTMSWMLDSPRTVELATSVLNVWGLGAFACVLLWACQHSRELLLYRRRVPVPASVEKQANDTLKKMGYPNLKCRVWFVYGVTSAELVGYFRPVIYLPKQQYTDEDLNNIITHELVHYFYGDKLFRELGMLVQCLYWFNPLTWLMFNQLKIWDEYHCDYQACSYDHIDKKSYSEALSNTVMNAVKGNLLNPCFKEEGCEIVKRLEFIREFGKTGRKKWLAAVMTMTAVFTLLGSSTALAAGLAVNDVMNEVAIATAEHEFELADDGDELIEYTMTEDDLNGANIITDDSVSPYASFTISVTMGNDVYQTPMFRAETGDTIFVQVFFDPEDIPMKMGIVQPNGVWRYVYGSGSLTKTFDVTMTGYHKVFVWNETTNQVTVIGGYRHTEAN